MRRDKNSSHSIKFVLRNSLNYENCRNYVQKLCDEMFEIKNYEFKPFINDEICLSIKQFSCEYKIYLDSEFIELKLIKSNTSVTDKLIRRFTKDGCWFEALKFLSKGLE